MVQNCRFLYTKKKPKKCGNLYMANIKVEMKKIGV